MLLASVFLGYQKLYNVIMQPSTSLQVGHMTWCFSNCGGTMRKYKSAVFECTMQRLAEYVYPNKLCKPTRDAEHEKKKRHNALLYMSLNLSSIAQHHLLSPCYELGNKKLSIVHMICKSTHALLCKQHLGVGSGQSITHAGRVADSMLQQLPLAQ